MWFPIDRGCAGTHSRIIAVIVEICHNCASRVGAVMMLSSLYGVINVMVVVLLAVLVLSWLYCVSYVMVVVLLVVLVLSWLYCVINVMVVVLLAVLVLSWLYVLCHYYAGCGAPGRFSAVMVVHCTELLLCWFWCSWQFWCCHICHYYPGSACDGVGRGYVGSSLEGHGIAC